MSRVLVVTLTVALSACVTEGTEPRSTQSIAITGADESAYALLHRARDLSSRDAERLEEELLEHPGDVATRTLLIMYYERVEYGDGSADASSAGLAREEHVLWLIAHVPQAAVLALPDGQLSPWSSERYAESEALWMQQVRDHAGDSRILWNAAASLRRTQPETSTRLLEEGRHMEPDDPAWASQLGHFFSLQKDRCSNTDANLARRSLDAYEDALAKTLDETGHFYLLKDVAQAAYDAGNVKAARWYAEELLSMAEAHPRDWNYGNAIHDGNTVLGRIALAGGNVPEAINRLDRAGRTPGSPQLNSFGPEMTLAQELLERGERAAVVEYLTNCRRFWMHRDRLDGWIASIQNGEKPELSRF